MNKERITINREDSITHVGEEGEKRQYYLFREKDPNYPLEVILTEIPPGHIQPFHKHDVIDEISIVLDGELVGLTKKGVKSPVKEKKIEAVSIYDPDRHYLQRITAAEDGAVLLVLEDTETGEIFGGELPFEEGFNAGKLYHAVENRTDNWVTSATLKRTSPEIFSKNERIFQEDKTLI